MTAAPKALYRAAVNDSSQRTATVPAAKQWIVTNLVLANYSTTISTTMTVSLDGIPLVSHIPLAPLALFTLDCSQVLDTNKVLSLVMDGAVSSVGVHISGVERDV